MPALAASLFLALAAAPRLAAAESVLGLYVFHRHGDRSSKSWPPTLLTALGADEVFASGTYFRDRYVASNASADTRVAALAPDVAVLSQLAVTAPVDNVLQNSANVFVSALYPPAGAASQQTLGNGTVTEPPLGGYQYVPVNIVSSAASSSGSESSAWLQGNSGCNNAVASSNAYFLSDSYLTTLNSTKDFYQGLLPAINTTFPGSKASFLNAYTIYDYVHVSEIHNQTLLGASVLTNDSLFQLQTRADQHEWGLAYNQSEPVRAIAGAVLAGQILQALNETVLAPPAAHAATRLNFQFGAYGTFMSFFGLANLTAASPQFYGIVDYASAMAFELVTNATTSSTTAALDPSDVSVRFLFANGSAPLVGGLTPFPLFGQSDLLVPWTTFASEMGKIAIGDTASWCKACGNSTGVCDPASLGTGSATSSGGGGSSSSNSGGGSGSGGVSRPVAGVIGAMVTLAVILGLEALVLLLGGLRLVRKDVAAAGKAASNGH